MCNLKWPVSVTGSVPTPNRTDGADMQRVVNQPLPGNGDPATWAPLQQRRPLYPYNPDITTVVTTTSIARSNYNALQATFKQQLWQGVNFVANYAYSKALADSRGFYGSPGVPRTVPFHLLRTATTSRGTMGRP